MNDEHSGRMSLTEPHVFDRRESAVGRSSGTARAAFHRSAFCSSEIVAVVLRHLYVDGGRHMVTMAEALQSLELGS